MPKTSSVFILLMLIFKIIFSSDITEIEMMENFKAKIRKNVKLNNFFPPAADLKNTNILRSQSKLNNLLIYISSDKFKYNILPFLSSQNFIKIYLHFQKLDPELNFEKFLPPSRFYTIISVLNLKKPTTYLQPLEINTLYQFHYDYVSLNSSILYSLKHKIPYIFNPHCDYPIPISSDSICAIISESKIIFYNKTYLAFGQELLTLRDEQNGQFFVTLPIDNGKFINLASGEKILEIEFSEYVECIWEAYNLKGWKKVFLKFKYFFTIPFLFYVKYLVYVVKIYSFCESRLLRLGEVFQYNLEQCINFENRSPELQNCLRCLTVPFVIVYLAIIIGGLYAINFVIYVSTLFPFWALSYPLKFYFFGFNLFSFWLVTPGLATLYACFFPQIIPTQPGLEPKYFLENILKSFQIKPKNTMSIVPLLVQKRKLFLTEFVHTLLFFVCILCLGMCISLPIVIYLLLTGRQTVLTGFYI